MKPEAGIGTKEPSPYFQSLIKCLTAYIAFALDTILEVVEQFKLLMILWVSNVKIAIIFFSVGWSRYDELHG